MVITGRNEIIYGRMLTMDLMSSLPFSLVVFKDCGSLVHHQSLHKETKLSAQRCR